ncbi:sulfotransferase [Pontibacter liquoris]|uniref:sulfotransferase n=1 Tax=Pontibacter liquoris TaxID=2905677 RepID=UPI001FA731B8|nr:sulfotransferase [Pontibacter liquoris]
MSWLYIAGRGHSGSTFLDIVLGNNKKIESYGEVISAIARLDSNCGCGQVMAECPFWSSVITSYQSSKRDWLTDVLFLKDRSHIKYWPQLLLSGSYGKRNAELVKINEVIHNLIQDNANADWILDSSKEPTRALFLLSSNPQSKIIHILRDPLDVANSYKKRFVKYGYFRFLRRNYESKKYFFFFAAIIGLSWTFGNLMIEVMKLKYPNRIFKFQHEKMLSQFDQSTKELEEFIGVDLSDIREKQNSNTGFIVGHNIGGNHIRNDNKIFLKTTPDKRSLSKLETMIVLVTTWPLRLIYKY